MLILIQDSTCQLKKSSLISAERVNSQQTIKSNQTNVVFFGSEAAIRTDQGEAATHRTRPND